ncbi:MAG: VWA domain-containing protein [Gemmatimonadales bacterium]
MRHHPRGPRSGIVVVLLAAGSAMLSSASSAQTPTITAPDQATVASSISLSWTGPSEALEFISVDTAGAPESSYGTYVYARVAQPATLQMPELPGRYVLRYHTSAAGYPVIASRPIEITDVQASFTALSPVEAGAPVTIAWQGPAYERDFISIDRPGDGDRTYGPYAYTTTNPVSIRAPDVAGAYVVRYHLAGGYRVIGQTDLTVGSVEASIDAPAEAQAGAEVSVTWEGPNASLDYISVDSAGAPDGEYGTYAYTRDGSPLTIRLPEEPGSYAIRYHMGQSNAVIGSKAIQVLPNSATVAGPASVVAATDLEVRWTGPDNAGDYLTITPVGADTRTYLDYAYTREGPAVTIEAPLDAGSYELRYVTGRSRQVLASQPITVTPGAIPGNLRVVGDGAGVPRPGSGAVEVILDASGSMLQRIDGVRRIELAKQALDRLVTELVPAGTSFAFRAFGHREAGSCRTDLEIALSPLAPASATSRIETIQAMNLARTPIAGSLALVRDDLAGVTGPVVVVLVTDGEETCDGDPAATIEALRRSGLDVRVNIVGFAIDEQQLRETFQSWSRIGNGRYIEANDGAELAEAMGASLGLPFEVLSGGEVVGTGIVDGPSLRLAPGSYTVRILEAVPRDLPAVTVEPDGDHVVRAAGG